VTYDAASEAKYTKVGAISPGLAHLPSGILASVIAASFSLPRMFSVMPVAASGATAFTVTRLFASSRARDLVIPTIAAFAAL